MPTHKNERRTGGRAAPVPVYSGWAPLPCAVWMEVAETFTKPWSRPVACADLTTYQSVAIQPVDPVRFPSIGDLTERWGWSAHEVRRLLTDEAAWSDPTLTGNSDRAARWSAIKDARTSRSGSHGSRTDRARIEHGSRKEATVEPTESTTKAHGPHEDRARIEITSLNTRVGSQTTDHRPQDTGETETRAPEVAPSPKPKRSASVAPEVAAVWSVYREEQAAIGSKRGESPPKGWGVAARVADPTIGADGMIAVIRWAHRSPHDRAKHLRDGGYLGDTLFRESKAPEYLPLALAWRDGTGPQPKPTGPGVLFGGSTFASKAEPAPTFPPPCRRWSNVLARLRLDGDAELVAAWLADSDLLDDRTVGVRTAHHVDWLTTAGGGLDPATEDMTAAIADALDVPRHRLRFVERPRVALEVPA